jgi:hypothetical protein
MFRMADVPAATAALGRLLRDRHPNVPSPQEVRAIVAQYHVEGRTTRELFTAAFQRAVTDAVANGAIDDQERTYLEKLKSALTLSDTETRRVFEEAGSTTIKREINGALRDELLSAEEKERLTALAQNLQVSDALLTRWTQEAAQPIFQRRADGIVADRRLSPDEEQELSELARNLGGVLTLDDQTQRTLDKYRLLWQCDNGLLPEIAVPLALQRGEVCHAQVKVSWYETRTVTTSVSYAGITGSFRIVKGVRFRVGNIAPVRHTRDTLTLLDTGTLYITNKRLIFMGTKRNITVRLSNVLSFEVYADGIEIQKASGRPPFVEMDRQELELIAAVLGGALSAT